MGLSVRGRAREDRSVIDALRPRQLGSLLDSVESATLSIDGDACAGETRLPCELSPYAQAYNTPPHRVRGVCVKRQPCGGPTHVRMEAFVNNARVCGLRVACRVPPRTARRSARLGLRAVACGAETVPCGGALGASIGKNANFVSHFFR